MDFMSTYLTKLLPIFFSFFFLPPNLSTIPETHTPQRKGLRSSALRPKKPEPTKQTGPVVIETWVPEEELDLWEIRAFSERLGGRDGAIILSAKQKPVLCEQRCPQVVLLCF